MNEIKGYLSAKSRFLGLFSYQRLQKKCADPYKQHLKKQVKSKSRVISLNIFLIYQYYFLKIINVSS